MSSICKKKMVVLIKLETNFNEKKEMEKQEIKK